MGKKPKKKSKQEKKYPEDKRPVQLIIYLVTQGIGVLLLLCLWWFYAGVVGGNSLPVRAEYLQIYRTLLLGLALFDLLICVLLFLGLKVGFWVSVVLVSLSLVSRVLSLRLSSIFIDGLFLYLLLCQPTRIYFRIGEFKSFGPRKK